MPLNFSVTLVIPILNEAESLPELLEAIKAQTLLPRKIIFSDAGSTDGSRQLIEAWWCEIGWPEGDCQVLSLPGAMPGAGRNAGVRTTESEWVAFLDGGITPETDWLEKLYYHARTSKSPAVFGVCHFSARSAFAKAVCALSYGHGATHPVIPASLFRRSVFDDIGFFPEKLRAGEDLVWVNRLIARFGPREICTAALVRYTHFPTGWLQAIRKWRITEYHCVLAGVRTAQQLAYVVGFPLICFILLTGGWAGVAAFLVYVALRGVLDPARRSIDMPWWGNKPLALLIAPILIVGLDLGKLVGILQGTVAKVVTAFTTRSQGGPNNLD